MFAAQIFKLRDQTLWLSPGRCIYWEERQALIIADLHFGKTGHFRKSGIAVPQNAFKEDLQRLVSLIQQFSPGQLIIAGDFSHSDNNKELDLFRKWRKDLSSLTVHLIRGNHDILDERWYESSQITVHDSQFILDGFEFVHDMNNRNAGSEDPEVNAEMPGGNYFFTGHIHPGIRISGPGKQSLRFPCFYFTKKYCVLPAFSRFTGLALIEPKKDETVFGIVENSVMSM